ncbi:uncharacterized protein LOC132909493 [Bombus pascuorum]|uniref:uncharacterized protein LOC132909493 n=1 Tax=Bombus pascuorum TaxID=65598 RepID=UPI00298DA275|nr:uncharacterized protein LOC132909493 [Bombus pascuorum]
MSNIPLLQLLVREKSRDSFSAADYSTSLLKKKWQQCECPVSIYIIATVDFRVGSVSSNTKYGFRCSIAILFSTANTRNGCAESIEVIIPKLSREKSILKEKSFVFCACSICYECLTQKQRHLYSSACLARTKISLSFMLNFQFNRISVELHAARWKLKLKLEKWCTTADSNIYNSIGAPLLGIGKTHRVAERNYLTTGIPRTPISLSFREDVEVIVTSEKTQHLVFGFSTA